MEVDQIISPPLLVRFDTHMNEIKTKEIPKFIIRMLVLYDDPYGNFNIKVKYNINLFKYNINSKNRKDCNSLMKDYHSKKGNGKGCAYIGFLTKI